MALWSTSFQVKQHKVGMGGERGTEQKGGRKETANGTRNGQGTAKGEADGCKEASRERKGKSNSWWVTRRSTGNSTGEEVPIRFGTYNIRNGRNGGLESELWGMAQANMDLGIF